MRLEPEEVAAIKAAAAEIFGRDAVVRLFGSRVDDALRGGDIDLHIEVPNAELPLHARGRFVAALHRTIGEREYDIVLAHVGRGSPIDKRAAFEGIVL